MAGMSLNRVTLIGNIGKDPEFRPTSAGGRFCSFSIATSERWRDRNNQIQERTEWHRIVIFAEPLVNIVERFGRRGARVLLEGQIQTRKYTDSQNIERYTTEIVIGGYNGQLIFLDKPPAGPAGEDGQNRQQGVEGGGYGGQATNSRPASGGGQQSTYYENQQRGGGQSDAGGSDYGSFNDDDDAVPF